MSTLEPYMTTEVTNTTNPACTPPDTPIYVGFIATAIAVFFYGTTYIPVKKFDTGDGLFFQWVFGISIGLYSLVVDQIRGNPTFYPGVMLGGFLFITGNLTVVPILKLIGIGLGFSLWGVTNLLSGWATGRFGLFGLKKDPPDNLLLNDIGVILAVLSAVIFSFVNNEISMDLSTNLETTENSPLVQKSGSSDMIHKKLTSIDGDIVYLSKKRKSTIESTDFEKIGTNASIFSKMSPAAKRILGVGLSLLAGLVYGQVFTPFLYVQNNYNGASQNALDYVFSTLSGSAVASTFYFLIYAAVKRNRPVVYPRVILPAFVSGFLWTVATTCWFVANKVLSEAVAFPIITTGPAVIANLLAVLVFKEIKGLRNLLILAVGMAVTVTGALMAGFSKQSKSC